MSKFFTYEERLELQKYLKESLSFKEISRRMAKNPTTISREIRKYSSEVATGYPGYPFNACKNRYNCRAKDICGKSCTRKATIYCKLCNTCNDNCPDFILEICTARYRVPYVCNGCEALGKCSLLKNIYEAEYAHIKAHESISQSRSGLCVSEDEIDRLNRIISTKGGKCLLTIHFVDTSFMLTFLREANTSKSVIDIFNYLDKTLGKDLFTQLFPVILTDNGSEFSNPKAIEHRESFPSLRTHLFYCDAGSPYQKGSIEVNHELIRRNLPKGSSFNHLTQEDINLMMNHINSYKRKKLNNRSPYETFSFYHGEEVLHKLGCAQVAASDIMIKPALLKR